ncbi:MAG: TM2 domain-containing protein [Eubacteriales bacterium]
MKNKWIALLLCLFFGIFGAHKFYEGRILLGVVYILTAGFFTIGVILDFISILFKPNPYYV